MPDPPSPSAPLSPVWLVDKSAESETYSNGLRIDTRFESPNRPRAYLVFPADRPDDGEGVRRTVPAGIVYHTTESRQLPFEASANRALKQVGESLIDFVRRRHAYNFLIDRFGRVFRIVPESDAADHAGYSVWADDSWLYVNLNGSFLGVSFEARTEPGQEDPTVSPAQIHSAAMLTDMLRARYGIAAGNCVTHAQVSVNPVNMRVGYHTDWASSFPFAQLGLPDNYARPLPAIVAFGFEYDETFVQLAGGRDCKLRSNWRRAKSHGRPPGRRSRHSGSDCGNGTTRDWRRHWVAQRRRRGQGGECRRQRHGIPRLTAFARREGVGENQQEFRRRKRHLL